MVDSSIWLEHEGLFERAALRTIRRIIFEWPFIFKTQLQVLSTENRTAAGRVFRTATEAIHSRIEAETIALVNAGSPGPQNDASGA